MAYCRNCGAQLEEGQKFCLVCGKADKNDFITSSIDTGGLEWGVLGFFIPLAGLVLYLIWREEKPKTARIAGKGALISAMLTAVLFVLYVIMMVTILIASQ
ncbi:MAG TPA: zinc ribbon domain-containing protein [Bacilli bacterium]|nr:zinc ribbon domain-containing protein [Bacilli bacterium]